MLAFVVRYFLLKLKSQLNFQKDFEFKDPSGQCRRHSEAREKNPFGFGYTGKCKQSKIGAEVEKSTNFHRFASKIAFKMDFFLALRNI